MGATVCDEKARDLLSALCFRYRYLPPDFPGFRVSGFTKDIAGAGHVAASA